MDWLGILWISQKCLCALCLGSMLFENYIFAAGQPQPYGEFQTVSLQGWRSNPTWLFQKCILPKYKIQPIENSWNILTSSRNGTSVSNSGTNMMWNLGFCLYHKCCVNMSSTFLFCGSDFGGVRCNSLWGKAKSMEEEKHGGILFSSKRWQFLKVWIILLGPSIWGGLTHLLWLERKSCQSVLADTLGHYWPC